MKTSTSPKADYAPSTAANWADRCDEDFATGQRIFEAGLARTHCECSHQEEGYDIAQDAADNEWMEATSLTLRPANTAGPGPCGHHCASHCPRC